MRLHFDHLLKVLRARGPVVEGDLRRVSMYTHLSGEMFAWLGLPDIKRGVILERQLVVRDWRRRRERTRGVSKRKGMRKMR